MYFISGFNRMFTSNSKRSAAFQTAAAVRQML
jgi:hypothetical protein